MPQKKKTEVEKEKKKKGNNIGMENLKGFFRKGATMRSPGNIPTGHFDLDFVIHYGVSPKNLDLSTVEGYDPKKPLGFHLGKVVELFGPESSGKSSIAYRVCGFAQKMGYSAVWIDAENSFSDDLADINGVDREELIFSDLVNDDDPDIVYCAEDIFNGIIGVIKRDGVPHNKPLKKGQKRLGVIVLDSVANLIPRAKMEATAEDQQPAVVARLLSNELKKYGILVIFINQVRDKVGVMFGNPETTPGGKALKFNASLRVRVGQTSDPKNDIYHKNEDGEEVLMGRKSTVSLAKNRFAKPYKGNPIEVKIWYESYFPNHDDVVFREAKKLKIIKPSKGVLKWKEEDVAIEGDGDTFMKAIRMRGLSDKLLLQVLEATKENNSILPPELAQMIDMKVRNGELSSDVVPVDDTNIPKQAEIVVEATEESQPASADEEDEEDSLEDDSEEDDDDGDDLAEPTE